MSDNNGNSLGMGLAAAGLFLGLGVASLGYAGSVAVDLIRDGGRNVTVKGLSERDVLADVGSWRISYRTVAENQQTAMQEALAAQESIINFARKWQFADEEILPEPLSIRIENKSRKVGNNQYQNYNNYYVSGAVRLRSNEVMKIRNVTTKTSELLRAGIILGDQNGGIPKANYSFLGLNAIKPDMIAEATKNAREAAAQFAQDAGQEIDSIKFARQGAVQIIARDGTIYQEQNELNKRVRVVTTVTYTLK